MINKRVYTITQLLTYLKSKLNNDPYLTNISVEGEIGNFKPNFSGHWYFSLKDNNGIINCAMFKGSNLKVQFMPKDGDKVIVSGNVSVYEKSGQMQLVITSMELSGAGNFYIQFEKMRQKLAPLGYFDANRKKKIPKYPDRIAVVTGANTAALRDIQITISNRWPIAKLLIFPAQVQGLEAPASIINALLKADQANADVCILARGGGSVDDLWCFNDENIATTIFKMKTPIVTGIGHEIDTTIADLVSDERCATPTAAAQRVTPNQKDVKDLLDQQITTMCKVVEQRINIQQQNLDFFLAKLQNKNTYVEKQQRKLQLLTNILETEMLKRSSYLMNRYSNSLIKFKDCGNKLSNNITGKLDKYELLMKEATNQNLFESNTDLNNYIFQLSNSQTNLFNRLRESNERIDNLNQTNEIQLSNRIKMAQNEFCRRVELLESVSPLKVLSRGYSITSQDNTVLKSIKDVDLKKDISIRLKDGIVMAKTVKKEEING